MDRHVRSITTERDERDTMPDLNDFVPLLSPPLIFRNGKIVKQARAERSEAPNPDRGLQRKRKTYA